MRELPILFSTPMAQAILDDRKSMTRRVIKPQPTFVNKEYSYVICNAIDKPSKEIKCPYGQPGDLLWVKETWKVGCIGDSESPGFSFKYRAGADDYVLNAYPTDEERFDLINKYVIKKGWQPSLLMPKEAARLWLEVTSVRVERLRDITEEDVIAEGTKDGDKYISKLPPSGDVDKDISIANWHIACFWELWSSINSKRGYGWYANPWVWVVEFKVVE